MRRVALVAAFSGLVAVLMAGFGMAVPIVPSRTIVAHPAPVETPTPTPTALSGGVLATFDPLALARALPDGSECQALAPTNPASVYGTDRHSVWAIGCPHASGDQTVNFQLADAIKADLERGDFPVESSHAATSEVPKPLENGWRLVGDGVVVFARIIAFDDGSMLSMAITFDTATQ